MIGLIAIAALVLSKGSEMLDIKEEKLGGGEHGMDEWATPKEAGLPLPRIP
jgi:hypothetical protein